MTTQPSGKTRINPPVYLVLHTSVQDVPKAPPGAVWPADVTAMIGPFKGRKEAEAKLRKMAHSGELEFGHATIVNLGATAVLKQVSSFRMETLAGTEPQAVMAGGGEEAPPEKESGEKGEGGDDPGF